MTKQRYAQLAYRWAEKRWFLNDRSVVREWLARDDGSEPDPESLIDYFADKYGLDDPFEGWHSHGNPPARLYKGA